MNQDQRHASFAFRSRRTPGPAGEEPAALPPAALPGPPGPEPGARNARGRWGAAPRHEGSDDDLPTIDIRSTLRRLWRGKWIIGAAILIAGLLAMIPLSRMTPVYMASARVLFNLEQANAAAFGPAEGGGSRGENSILNQVEILRSTRLIERVVAELDLDANPEFNPFLNSGGAGTPEAEALERRLVIAGVTGRLALLPIQGTRVIEIQFRSADPQTAAAVVNTLAEQYIVDQLDAQLEATRAATAWLSERVQELRDRVQAAEEAVVAARAEQSREAGQGLEITQQQLAAASASLNAARSETRATRGMVERLATALEEGQDLGAVPDFRASPIISGFRSEIASLSSQAKLFTEGSYRLTEINRQIEELGQLMRDEAARMLEAARTDLASKEEREAVLVAEMRELENKALEQSREGVGVRQLERDAEASRILYENFLSRLKETTAQQDIQRAADARILSAAEPPLRPMAQARQRTLMIALALGALIGIAIVLLLEKLNNTFRSPAQIEERTGAPVIGTIPTIGRRFRKTDVLRHFKENPKSSLAESIRSLRTSILFTNVDRPPRVVMVTSSVPGEAKSTTAMLVAITSQQMGRSAIIVDCDLRLPTLARLLGEDVAGPGLMSVIEGTADLDEAISRDPSSGLHALMTKPSEPFSHVNAADFLASNRFRDLIAELRRRYDLVILDAPPTLVVADARILSPLVDAVVYLVRWDKTPRDAVEEGLKEMRLVGAPLAGVALTMINEQRAARHAYEGYSYHKGRYREYFDTDRPAPGLARLLAIPRAILGAILGRGRRA